MKRYFITGTDTDCGKTYVTRALLDQHPKSIALKPVASGCYQEGDQLISCDAQLLIQGTDITCEQINPWRYALPVSPHIAAAKQGKVIDIDELVDYCLGFEINEVERVFIEGAGGLLAPLTIKHTWLDFLLLSKIPVLLVVGMKLGCINHALLTEKILRHHQIECVGWIANCLDATMLALKANIDTLEQLLEMPFYGIVPYAKSLKYRPTFTL